MAVNGGHAGTKKGPNWGHVREKLRFPHIPRSRDRKIPPKYQKNTPQNMNFVFFEFPARGISEKAFRRVSLCWCESLAKLLHFVVHEFPGIVGARNLTKNA